MHPRLAEVFAYVDGEHERFRATFSRVAPARRDIEPVPGRWSAIQIVEHCAVVNATVAKLIAREIAKAREAGIGQELSTEPILSSLQVERVRDRSHTVKAPASLDPAVRAEADVWAGFDAATEAVKAAALTGDGLALATASFRHPALGPLSLYQWIAFAGSHTGRHTGQLRECI